MAVWIYKGDKKELINAIDLNSALKSGWSTKKGGNNEQEETKAEALPDEEALREEAKAAKIKGWHLMKVDKLKEALGYAD